MKIRHLLLLSPLPLAYACQAAQPPKPNVIFILMDDLGYGDLGCMGQTKIETPNIDALRRSGILFTQHYSGSPVSAPSRCVLLTGLHSGHAQIKDNQEMAWRGATSNFDSMYVHSYLEGQAPLKAGTQTLATVAQEAGYATALCGKWGLGYPGSEGTPNKQGFDYFYGYNCQRQCHTYYPAFLYENEERVYLRNKVQNPHQARLAPDADPNDVRSYDFLTQQDYANDLIFEALCGFVKEKRDKPFFLMWATPLPHVSLMAPKKWVDYYVAKFGDETPYLGQSGYAPCRYPHATYAAMISYFDEQVGQLMQLLKDEGLYENTLLIFTSDNGPTFNGGTDSPWFQSGGPFKSEYGWGKCFLHEGGIRVPLIVSWPNYIKPGRTSDHVSAFQDFMPTLAQVFNANASADSLLTSPTDGLSFLPTLLDMPDASGSVPGQEQHPFLYFEFPEKGKPSVALRVGNTKTLIQYGKDVQVFDLEKDPRELHDLVH